MSPLDTGGFRRDRWFRPYDDPRRRRPRQGRLMRVGIVGDSPWVRPLVRAARSVGAECCWLAPETADRRDEATRRLVARRIVAGTDDRAALDELVHWSYVVTCDPRTVPAESAAYLGRRLPVFPRRDARLVATEARARDAFVRRLEEAWLRSGGRLLGSDPGDGAARRSPAREDDARRLTIVGVRGRRGELVFYPIAEEIVREGRRIHAAPAPSVDEETGRGIRWLAKRILVRLDLAGVLGTTFRARDGRLSVERIVPWVSGIGAWTLEGIGISQFENHLRAICGWPPGAPGPVRPGVTVELLDALPDRARIESMPGARLHVLREPRPGRLVGLVTLPGEDTEDLLDRAVELTADRPGVPTT